MKLISVSLDDWSGVYNAESGQIITQGHSIDWQELLEKLGHTVESKYISDPNDLDEFGNSLPVNFEDLRKYMEDNNL